MAFSQAPTQDTYSQQTISLANEVYSRDGSTKDEDALNVFFEPIKNKFSDDRRVYVVKRAGTVQQVASVASATVRGMHYWADQSKLLYAVDNDIYVYNVNTASSTTLSNPFGTTSGYVGFCEFLYDNGTTKVVATDGTTLITIDSSNTVVTCADGDLPSPHLPYPVFLDGYLFLAKAASASIYNSDLNDPLAWTAGEVIDAEMEGDLLVRICKINNYLAAFGTGSIEYFWDAANTSGSPLQRNDTPVKLNRFLGGFATHGNSVYFVGLDSNAQPDVFVLKDFKLENLGNPTITRYLVSTTDGPSTWTGTIVSCLGHSFYVLNAGTARTYIMDVDTKIWYRWAWQATDYFPITHAVGVTQTAITTTWFAQEGSTSPIYRFSDTLYQDNSTNFTCQGITLPVDFGTLNRKTMHRLIVHSDYPSASTSVNISWSDNDGTSFNTPIAVDLYQDLPSIQRLGQFRERLFKWTYADNYPLRLREFEVDINKGNS